MIFIFYFACFISCFWKLLGLKIFVSFWKVKNSIGLITSNLIYYYLGKLVQNRPSTKLLTKSTWTYLTLQETICKTSSVKNFAVVWLVAFSYACLINSLYFLLYALKGIICIIPFPFIFKLYDNLILCFIYQI